MKVGDVFWTATTRYTVVERVGQGGSGVVHRVRDDDGSFFAAKFLSGSGVTTEKKRRFRNELMFSLRNRHPNVIAVLDHGVVSNEPFYVMPYYGDTLRTVVTSKLEPSQALSLFSQLLDGVEAAHLKGIWHRDLKPENVLYDAKTNTLVVADFGVAHFGEEDLFTAVQTNDRTRLANFLYAAPEQRSPGKAVDQRADLYALGLILCELFTNEVPQGTGHRTVVSVAPDYAYLDEIIDRLRRQEPDERPRSIDDLKQLLISRRLEFVSRQKLDSLTGTVVARHDVSTAVSEGPTRIVGKDFQDPDLVLELDHDATPAWQLAFKTMQNFGYPDRYHPSSFRFVGRTARVTLHYENDAQRVVDFFKGWLDLARKRLTEMVEADAQKQEAQERAALQARLASEERRLRLLQGLKIS
jgi:serine/threonine protein kinase